MSKVILIPTKYGKRFKRVNLVTFNKVKAKQDVAIDGVDYTGLLVKVWNASLVQVKQWSVKPAVVTPVNPDPPVNPAPPVEPPREP